MSIELRFLAAVVRKADIESHYPGGLPAFERHQVVAMEDDHLVALFAMSGSEIAERIDDIARRGFDTDRFIAMGDMWVGPVKHAAGIRFASDETLFPPVWYALSDAGDRDA